MKKKQAAVILLSVAVILAAAGCGNSMAQKVETAVTQTEVPQNGMEAENSTKQGTPADNDTAWLEGKEEFKETAEKSAEYLKLYFDIAFAGDPDAAAFTDALMKISGDDAERAAEVKGELNWESAVEVALDAGGYRELALSYDEEKAEERLRRYGLNPEGKNIAGIACAVDTDLITPEEALKAMKQEALDTSLAYEILMKVADAQGKGRNFLGLASDPDIFGKIDKAWNSFMLFDDSMLSDIGRKAVEQNITTGYGLKSSSYDARFLPKLTLQYGHSDIMHAHQLVGLLDSENINARIQLEPKVSIYRYLLEWGPVPEPTQSYEVKKFSDDLYLVYAVEYDLKLEFAEEEDMMAFDRVIKKFAKKSSDNADMEGLIRGSWWQPLYSTTRDTMPSEDYHLIYDCVMKNGQYSIHPFALPEKKEEVSEQLSALGDGIKAEPVERYVNTAFYNYLSGQDYQ